MFTIGQIKAVHSQVKSGADFPNYIRDIKQLGVILYETYVTDGHSDYYGEDHYKRSSPASSERLQVADTADVEQFSKELKEHQQGKTNYATFCSSSAKAGVDKWVVDLMKMTCTYYDRQEMNY